MIFFNLFNARPYAKKIHELVLKCLFDAQLEVRVATLMTLSGLYQCGYIQVTTEDLVGSLFSFTKINVYLRIVKELLRRYEQDQLFHKNR